MFSFAFWGLVLTIGGREGEVAHNLICRHSAIVLPGWHRCTASSPTTLSPTPSSFAYSRVGGDFASALITAPLPSRRGNALIRVLHAYNTYVRMKESQCCSRHVCILRLTPSLREADVLSSPLSLSLPHFIPYSIPTTLVASHIEVPTYTILALPRWPSKLWSLSNYLTSFQT